MPRQEFGGMGEEGAEADGQGRGDGALAEHDFVDRARDQEMARSRAFSEMPKGLR